MFQPNESSGGRFFSTRRRLLKPIVFQQKESCISKRKVLGATNYWNFMTEELKRARYIGMEFFYKRKAVADNYFFNEKVAEVYFLLL